MNTYKTDLLDLRCMDCMELMRDLPDNSVDSVVTDPPYGLSKEPDMAEVLRHWLAGDDYVHKGSGFMGKSWDSFVPGPTIWQEAYRVLKPGGHLLAFAGSRTQDLMGIAIRLAGFENRDCIMWVFGSGFPKSANVSKMIDKAAGAEREVVGPNRYDGRRTEGSGPNNGDNCYGQYGIPGGETAPTTPEAKQWDGWGTALKPAYEPCLMFRKPLAKGNTVAANVLEHGTGALNIDRARVAYQGDYRSPAGASGDVNSGGWFGGGVVKFDDVAAEEKGRWPANLIHDGSQQVLDLFPETKSGALKPWVNGSVAKKTVASFSAGLDGKLRDYTCEKSTGSAARFFYCAKASKKDRGEGCEGLEEREVNRYGEQGQGPLPQQTPRHTQHNRNHHPTVKPTELMRYLCRLVTPPGGTCLDPFMGSGSTGKAAILEGFRFIGSDMDEEYFEIAKSRTLASVERIKRETAQTTLF